MAKKKSPKFASPLDPDYPLAPYRVMCPVCGINLWADIEAPPVQGEEIIGEHDCPGRDPQLDVTPDSSPGAPVAARAATPESPKAQRVTLAGVARDVPPPPPKPKD